MGDFIISNVSDPKLLKSYRVGSKNSHAESVINSYCSDDKEGCFSSVQVRATGSMH